MYLTAYKADYTRSKIAQALAHAGRMHKLLLEEGFGMSRADAEVLYRIEKSSNGYMVFIKSANKPHPIDGFSIVSQRELKDEDLLKRRKYQFFIELTPKASDHGKFHYIKGDKGDPDLDPRYRRRARRTEWVRKQFEKRGMHITTCNEGEVQEKYFYHSDNKGGVNGHITSWKYAGTFEITDEAAFINAFKHGIGVGKAYGNGMLMLA